MGGGTPRPHLCREASRFPHAAKELQRMDTTLAGRWWTLALRGAAAILFGVLTFLAPGRSLIALVLLFGVYAIVDGALNLAAAFNRGPGARQRAGWLVFHGLAGIAAGLVTFFWPGITALGLLLVIASWAVVTGAAAVFAAIRLRKEIRREWLLGLSGLLSIAFGVLLLVYPTAGALAVVLWIGAYAVMFGLLLVGLGFKLRGLEERIERRLPHDRTPMPV
jgi:uncharacterized membrane protein HdeD (DUF308 family)